MAVARGTWQPPSTDLTFPVVEIAGLAANGDLVGVLEESRRGR